MALARRRRRRGRRARAPICRSGRSGNPDRAPSRRSRSRRRCAWHRPAAPRRAAATPALILSMSSSPPSDQWIDEIEASDDRRRARPRRSLPARPRSSPPSAGCATVSTVNPCACGARDPFQHRRGVVVLQHQHARAGRDLRAPFRRSRRRSRPTRRARHRAASAPIRAAAAVRARVVLRVRESQARASTAGPCARRPRAPPPAWRAAAGSMTGRVQDTRRRPGYRRARVARTAWKLRTPIRLTGSESGTEVCSASRVRTFRACSAETSHSSESSTRPSRPAC